MKLHLSNLSIIASVMLSIVIFSEVAMATGAHCGVPANLLPSMGTIAISTNEAVSANINRLFGE